MKQKIAVSVDGCSSIATNRKCNVKVEAKMPMKQSSTDKKTTKQASLSMKKKAKKVYKQKKLPQKQSRCSAFRCPKNHKKQRKLFSKGEKDIEDLAELIGFNT